MTKVLLSIKPHFADKIFSGQKKYEFRRAIFKRDDVKKVIVYASAPVSKAVGEFEIETILLEDLHLLWRKTKDFAGITKEYFFSYFNGVERGYAIRIKNYMKYTSPYCIRTKLGVSPPQSFIYIKQLGKQLGTATYLRPPKTGDCSEWHEDKQFSL